METAQLRFDAMRDLYQTQRDRREGIRNSLATPVAAFAFSIFDLSTLATHYSVENMRSAPGIAIGIIALGSVAILIYAASLIIRVERNFMYIDPPDLEGMLDAEARIRQFGAEGVITMQPPRCRIFSLAPTISSIADTLR